MTSTSSANFSCWTIEKIQWAIRWWARRRGMTFTRCTFRFLFRFNRSKCTLITGELLFLSMMVKNNTCRNLNITLRKIIQGEFHRISTNISYQSKVRNTTWWTFGSRCDRWMTHLKHNWTTNRRIMRCQWQCLWKRSRSLHWHLFRSINILSSAMILVRDRTRSIPNNRNLVYSMNPCLVEEDRDQEYLDYWLITMSSSIDDLCQRKHSIGVDVVMCKYSFDLVHRMEHRSFVVVSIVPIELMRSSNRSIDLLCNTDDSFWSTPPPPPPSSPMDHWSLTSRSNEGYNRFSPLYRFERKAKDHARTRPWQSFLNMHFSWERENVLLVCSISPLVTATCAWANGSKFFLTKTFTAVGLPLECPWRRRSIERIGA